MLKLAMKKFLLAGALVLPLSGGALAAAQTSTINPSPETGQSTKEIQLAQASEPELTARTDCADCHKGAEFSPAEGSVSLEEGLKAWARIYEVASHPRCANCHVGDDNLPMWSGPSYGKTRPHGMNINAGESRIGAETLTCSTCHTAHNTPIAHGAPGNEVWHLPPVEMQWFGKTSSEICAQLKNPETNGERTFLELAAHIGHDELVHWGWKPGIGREPAPFSIKEHAIDILQWGVAGMPCPTQ